MQNCDRMNYFNTLIFGPKETFNSLECQLNGIKTSHLKHDSLNLKSERQVFRHAFVAKIMSLLN